MTFLRAAALIPIIQASFRGFLPSNSFQPHHSVEGTPVQVILWEDGLCMLWVITSGTSRFAQRLLWIERMIQQKSRHYGKR